MMRFEPVLSDSVTVCVYFLDKLVGCNNFLSKVQPKIQTGNLITLSQVVADKTGLQVVRRVDNL